MMTLKSDPSTSGLLRRYRFLIKALGISEEERRAMLDAENVSSSTELSNAQLLNICAALDTQLKAKQEDAPKAIRRLRSTVLSILTEMRVYRNPGQWTQVNDYLRQPRIAGKALYDLSETELQQLIKKLRAVQTASRTKQEETERMAREN